jgi:adenosylcobinamide-phosphate synthase
MGVDKGVNPVMFLALGIDLAMGELPLAVHPVRLTGKATEGLQRRLPGNFSGGLALLVAVAGGAWLSAWALEALLKGGALEGLVLALALSSTFSLRGLLEAARKVEQLLRDDLQGARQALKALVGRDTQGLDEEGVLRATLESLAENASDSVVAPLFYYALGGLPLAMLYRAVNTLDAMVGYRHYGAFGLASARADDVLNFIPARATALLLALLSPLLGLSARQGLRCLLRDGGKHPSPNSGRPMAALAGALGVRLGGPARYQGQWVEKPLINPAGRKAKAEDLSRALRLVGLCSGVFALAVGVLT